MTGPRRPWLDTGTALVATIEDGHAVIHAGGDLGRGWRTCGRSSTPYLGIVVGWRVAVHMRTEMVLDAMGMARRSRGHAWRGCGHSDAGSRITSIRYGERLAEIGAVASIGTIADSVDDASPRRSTAMTLRR